MPKPNRQVLVCTNQRPPGSRKPCCADRGSVDLYEKLKALVTEKGMRQTVIVTRTGCLKHCSRGITVAVHPDNVWYTQVTTGDLEEICDAHLRDGEPVERLFMPDVPWE